MRPRAGPTEIKSATKPRTRDRPTEFREEIRLLEADGWEVGQQEGSQRQYKHPTKKGRVTVAGKPGDDMPIGTLASILRQAQLKEKR